MFYICACEDILEHTHIYINAGMCVFTSYRSVRGTMITLNAPPGKQTSGARASCWDLLLLPLGLPALCSWAETFEDPVA